MKTSLAVLIAVLAAASASAGCAKHDTRQEEAVKQSEDVLAGCRSLAFKTKEFTDETALHMVSPRFQDLERVSGEQKLIGDLALCEQQHTNRLLEAQLVRQ